MKKLALFLTLFIGLNRLQAQITLDNTYNADIYSFYLTKLHISGYKYVKWDASNQTIYLYNTNHSLFKTIVVPNLPAPVTGYVQYVSEQLFDLDNLVEYTINTFANGMPKLYIIKEDGTILFQKDSAAITRLNNDVFHNTSGIFYEGNATKMKLDIFSLQGVYGSTKIYTLPGSIPCVKCSEGIITGLSGRSMPAAGNALFYPNPVTDELKLSYALPKGYKTAEINVYDLQGRQIENFKVSSDFDFIYLPSGYNNGMYLYSLVVDGQVMKTEKVILNK